MFKILDGRSEFYQWDLNRKLLVADASIKEVHFCNRTGECSLVRDVYEVNGAYIVDVPNVLLQDSWDIKVYGFDSSYTKYSATFNVVARTRPENYVNDETEVLKYDTLVERMDSIEETIGETVTDYLEANPPEVELKDYYTKSETDTHIVAAVNSIVHPTPDLSDYATQGYVNTKIAELDIPEETDLSDYYTKSQTDTNIVAAIRSIEHPKTDLSNYYTREETNNQITNKIAAIPPTDLSGYYTKGETNTQIVKAVNAIEHPTTDLTGYYTKTETDTQIREKIAAIPETDLSDYYTKSETNTKIEDALRNIPTTPGEGGTTIIQSVEEVYVGSTAPTDEDIKLWIKPDEEVEFLTTEALASYYNKDEANTKIAETFNRVAVNHYTKTEIDEMFAAIVDGEEVSY